MRRFFDRQPEREAALYAEAAGLLEEGLELDFVLGLYPDEAEWLRPMLETSASLAGVYAQDQPSYYFEASLKAKVLAAGRRRAAPAPRPAYARLVAAGGTVVASAALMGTVFLGFPPPKTPSRATGTTPSSWRVSASATPPRAATTASTFS
jgi:hypothetical protein